MDRSKLLQIIQTNLDELSEINLEMSRNTELTKFEVDLALSKAKMIRQEYEFLQEIYRQEAPVEAGQNATDPEGEQEQAIPAAQNEQEITEEIVTEDTPIPLQDPEENKSEGNDFHTETVTAEIEIPQLQPMEATAQEEVIEEAEEQKEVVEEAEISTVYPSINEPMPESVDNRRTNGESHSMEKKTLTEQYQTKSLNDLLTASNKLDQRFASSPISKLENAIGLNDRFQYIRELFRNDADLFRNTITKLDRMHILEEAVEHLDAQFNWEKNNTSIQFMHLVKRRFSS